MGDTNINNHAAFIWAVADRLRGDYTQSEYGWPGRSHPCAPRTLLNESL